MKAIGPLMKEHRLIERMVALMEKELLHIKEAQEVDAEFIKIVVDFFKTYADKCHHGKEEKILFERLKTKKLSLEHEKILQQLIDEHILGRNLIKKLDEANEQYAQNKNDKNAFNLIQEAMEDLVKLYPQHIDTEDRHFFLPAMCYFTDEENKAILKEEFKFDRNMIHEVYKGIVERLSK